MLAQSIVAAFLRHSHKMLVHQIQDSEGAVTSAVNLTTRTIENSVTTGDCHSGIRLDNAGVAFTKNANNSNSQITGEWLLAGSAAGFFVQRTIISGTLDTDPGAGFLQLNATRTYAILQSSSGDQTTVIFLEISSDVSGVPIVDTATITMIAQVEE